MLLLHHKNEIIYDNRKENLEILCNKCHSIYHFKDKKRDKETCKKISKSLTWRKLSEEHKKKMIWNKNCLWYKHTEENKIRMSKSGKGKVFTKEHRFKLSKVNKWKILSEITKLKISISMKLSKLEKRVYKLLNI